MIQIMSKTFSAYTKPSSKVIADTGRSSGKVIRRKRCHPLAPSIAAASKTSGEMLCSPLYMMTRLNGMPIQMFAISTATRDQRGEVSQSTCPMPKARRKEFTIPESLSSIHDQVEAETSSGRSHGTRNRARRMPERRNLRKKNTASARPMANWNAIETKTKIAVLMRAGEDWDSRQEEVLSGEDWDSRQEDWASGWTFVLRDDVAILDSEAVQVSPNPRCPDCGGWLEPPLPEGDDWCMCD